MADHIFTSAPVLQVAFRSLLGIVLVWIAQFLHHAFSNRLQFQRMKALGLPVPEPHSLLLGHLPLMKSLRRGLPKDAPDTYAQLKLTCPPIIYLDMWPFVSYPLILATTETPMFGWAISPVTGGRDLIAMDIPTHRVWRSRLNPCFSLRNLTSLVPILTEEVDIFVQKMREEAGNDKTFGVLFPLYNKTVDLSFDIIMRAALDLRLNTYVKGENIRTKLQRMMPTYRRDVAVNTSIIDNILRPHIHSRTDLAMQSTEEGVSEPSPELVDIVISQLKLFVLAGHHTTAQAVCWVLYEVYSRPEVLDHLSAEMRQGLGLDAKSLLTEKPHKLNELQYTAAVIKETLRFHPIASTHRQGSNEFTISIEGTTYPALNALMSTSAAAVHLRSDLWTRVTEFLPERFIVAEDGPLHPPKHAWRAFELGTTKCIGEELAMIEMKLILAFTINGLHLEFDWAGWKKMQNNSAPPESVDGKFMYRTGTGIGFVKGNLPTRVRAR
ncbi:cytochrome P450 [Xylaria venustula]|nr:cytochrome P450 [Xylaria venustula]